MTTTSADRERQRGERERHRAEQERQRFVHLVLGRPRPKAPAKRKSRRAAPPARLAPGVEEQVALREQWSHKQGTPETHRYVDAVVRRPGSLARLCESGAISPDQLAAAEQIVDTHQAITAEVRVRTAKLERVDGGHRNAGGEAFARVRAQRVYTFWRGELGPLAEPMLAIVVDDLGIVAAATRYRMSVRRTRRLLGEALDLWWEAKRRVIDVGG